MHQQTKKSELTNLYQQIQIAFDERLQSLALQVDSIQHNTQDFDSVLQLFEVYKQWKSLRGNYLLQNQYNKVVQTQRREELERFEKRILEQRHSLNRKEQEIWQQSWNGKRIRYLSMHPEHMLQFHNEIAQTQTLMQQFALKSRLLEEVNSLQAQLQVLFEEQKKIDFKRIETAFIKQLIQQNSREQQLIQLQRSLGCQLAQLARTQRELALKYQKSSIARDRMAVPLVIYEQGSIQISAKSISTNSEEQISGD